jgi:hypothetical protein
MKIGMYFDPYATSMKTVDEEYKEAQELLDEYIGCANQYEVNILPYKLDNNPVDIYVMDVGGLYGGEDMMYSHYRDLISQIQQKPNTLFILWSTFTQKWYKEIVEDEFSFLANVHNVMFRSDNFAEELEVYFSRQVWDKNV